MTNMINLSTKQYIAQHKEENTRQLALKTPPANVDLKIALQQISAYQNIKNKIPQWAETDDIIYPQKLSLEQCSSQNTAILKSQIIYDIFENKPFTMADLTGGMGVDCYFIALNASKAEYIEQNKELCALAAHNFEVLKNSDQTNLSINIDVTNGTAEEFIKTHINNKIDLIYVDPARRSSGGKKLISISDCQPNIIELLPTLRTIAQYIVIKLSPMLDIHKALSELKNTQQLIIISSNGECKELLAIIHGNCTETKITAINIKNNQSYSTPLNGKLSDEKELTITHSYPLKYIYEPYAAYLKSGLFKTIGIKYNLYKISQHAHIYTSNELKTDFPGRIFEVIEYSHFDKKNMKNISSKYPKANISTRDFPISAEELHKRYKINDGGDTYMFATTADDKKRIIIICRKIVK